MKFKNIGLILPFMILCLVAACSSSRSTVSQNIDLSKYEYASVMNNDTYHIPAELMKNEIQLFDAVEASGLKMVSDRRIYELSPQQQEKLLLVKYGVSISEDKSTVIVNFIDYATGRPVASCQGGYWGLGFDSGNDFTLEIKEVAKQIAKIFGK